MAEAAVIDSWLDVLALLAFIPFLLFVLVQAPSVLRGRTNTAGLAVFVLAVVCTLALSQSAWRQLVNRAPPNSYRLVVFLLVIVAGWWLLVSMIVVRRHDDEMSKQSKEQM